ncbi:MAG: MtrB/PioB family decaheme-associated outer membrane protein [Thermodesulfobacteriota bacterium]
MKKAYIPVTAMLAVLLPLASYADDKSAGGSIEVAPTLADVSGSKAKFNEYRDIEDGLYGAVRLWKETDTFFFNFQADDILYDTQSYRVHGGDYGRYKFNLFYDEIPHNLTYDAKTFYSGAGTANLTYSGANLVNVVPSTDTSTWNTFDYEVDRKNQGAGLRLDLLKPLYMDVSFKQEKREGIKPAGLAPGTTGGSSALELPEPVDYVTDNLKAEIGYSLDPIFASVSYLYSKFENDNDNLFFRHTVSANSDAFTLAPDNDYYKFAFKGGAKLPMSSTLNLNAGRSVAETSVGLFSSFLDTNGATTTTTSYVLSDSVFDGKVVTTNYDVILTGNPLSFLHGKLFYKFYEKENKSDEITHTRVLAGLDPFHNHLFGYEKDTYGGEIGIKLPANFTLTPSYKHVKTERHRGDLPVSKDDIYGIAARWSGLDFLTVRAGYERLERSSDWQQLTLVTGTQATANAIEPFIRRFDAAPLDQDTYKLSLDISPTDNLGIGLGYQHKKSEYTDTILGLRDDETDIFDVSADYTLGKVTLAGYFSYEKTDQFQFQRRFTSAAAANPLTDTTVGDGHYNWQINEENISYDYGLSAEVALVPDKWRIKAQFDHVNSNGTLDFTLYESIPTDFTNDTVDQANWDDYRKDSLQLKAIYDINKNLVSTFGYAYEKYKYSDAALDNYRYFFSNTSLTATNYLTGAYKDQSYEANVFFATMKYSF